MDEQTLNELVFALDLGGSSETVKQRECTDRLERLRQNQDFILYLLYVFATPTYAEVLRQRGGLFLKQFLKVTSVSPPQLEKVLNLV